MIHMNHWRAIACCWRHGLSHLASFSLSEIRIQKSRTKNIHFWFCPELQKEDFCILNAFGDYASHDWSTLNVLRPLELREAGCSHPFGRSRMEEHDLWTSSGGRKKLMDFWLVQLFVCCNLGKLVCDRLYLQSVRIEYLAVWIYSAGKE